MNDKHVDTAASRTEESISPRYQHDCDRCTFLGRFSGQFGDYDLYHCLQALQGRIQLPTVIARFSSHGPDYKSGINVAARDPELREALKRAKERGLPCG